MKLGRILPLLLALMLWGSASVFAENMQFVDAQGPTGYYVDVDSLSYSHVTEMQPNNAKKTYELVQMTRRSNVSRLLKESGSAVSEPKTPAKVIRPSSGSKGTAARAEKKAREQKDSTEVNESQDNG